MPTLDFDDELSLIFSSGGEFATAATLTIASVASTVYGLFDRAHQSVDIENVSVANAGPRFRCKSTSLASFSRKTDTVTISSVVYKVAAIEPIGTGIDSYMILKVD